MTSLRMLIRDEVIYDGDVVAVPRIGELIHHGDHVVPIEAVTWDFRQDGAVSVALVVGSQPYTY